MLFVGDIGQCGSPGPEITARIADWLLDHSGPVIVRFHTGGDNEQSDGSEGAYRACFMPAWDQFKSFLYPAVGNHDYWGQPNPFYYTYFGARAIWNGKDGYYSYAEGSWLVLVLNSELLFRQSDAERQVGQMAFMHAQLAANPEKSVIAIWHRPRWGHGENGDAREVQTFRDELKDRTGVILNGHEHHYERFSKLDVQGDRDDANGIRSFTVGTGGGFLYGFRNVRCSKSEFRHVDKNGRVTDFGVLRLRFRNNGTYSWEYFIWPDGAPEPIVVDSDLKIGTQSCP
jgi:hypothetical protein